MNLHHYNERRRALADRFHQNIAQFEREQQLLWKREAQSLLAGFLETIPGEVVRELDDAQTLEAGFDFPETGRWAYDTEAKAFFVRYGAERHPEVMARRERVVRSFVTEVLGQSDALADDEMVELPKGMVTEIVAVLQGARQRVPARRSPSAETAGRC